MHTGPFGDVPFLILSRDPDVIPSIPPGDAGANDSLWFSLQEGLKSPPSRARRIVARRSTHYIQIDRADLLILEVSVFIRQVRGDAPQPSDYGSTRTE
jgi:hypothetical protein